MELKKKVFGVFLTKEEAEEAVRKLLDSGFSTDEIRLEETTGIKVLIESDRDILDSDLVESEIDATLDDTRESKIMRRVEKFNKIKDIDSFDSRNITSSVIEQDKPVSDSMFDEKGVLKDSFKEDVNNPKLNRLDAEFYPYDIKVMNVSTEGDFSQKRYEPKELQRTKFRDDETITDDQNNED